MASLSLTHTAAFSRISSAGSQRRPAQAVRPRQFTVRAVSDAEARAAADNYRLTGMKTDTTGISVVDVIEPSVYVSEFGQEATSTSTSAGVLAGSLLLVGASFALITIGDRAPVLTPSAPTLSELVYKFEAEVEAAAPVLQIRATAPPLEISVADSTVAAEETVEFTQ